MRPRIIHPSAAGLASPRTADEARQFVRDRNAAMQRESQAKDEASRRRMADIEEGLRQAQKPARSSSSSSRPPNFGHKLTENRRAPFNVFDVYRARNGARR